MGEIAELFFTESWIDAPPGPGKRGGAYSASTVPSVHPYVFMNYTGNVRHVMTLAHELGHGIHQYLSREQGMLQAHTPLTTAEMASTFGEMLVFTSIMEQETDPKVRLAMLAHKIEDTFATIFRQISMNRFEHGMHTARRDEGELTSERISEIWMETQQAMFIDSVEMTDNYAIWWSYIPHFLHVPGYVYAYAFGELLVLALFARYRQEGDSFAPRYLDVLRAGGSDWPEKTLAPMGVDLTDPTLLAGRADRDREIDHAGGAGRRAERQRAVDARLTALQGRDLCPYVRYIAPVMTPGCFFSAPGRFSGTMWTRESGNSSPSGSEMTLTDRPPNEIYSEAIEDFLKAVYLLQQEQDRVQTSALAEALNITAPSTTEMAKKLAKANLVVHEPYRGIRLTRGG